MIKINFKKKYFLIVLLLMIFIQPLTSIGDEQLEQQEQILGEIIGELNSLEIPGVSNQEGESSEKSEEPSGNNLIFEAGEHECSGVVKADSVTILPGAVLKSKFNYAYGKLAHCVFKTKLFINQGKIEQQTSLEIIGNFKNEGEIGTYVDIYGRVYYPGITIDGSIENNHEIPDGFIFNIKNNSSLEKPIQINGSVKISLKLNDKENNKYFFADSLHLKKIDSYENEIEIYVPDDKSIFIEDLSSTRNVRFINKNHIEIGKLRFSIEIRAPKSKLFLFQGARKLSNIRAQEIVFKNGGFSYSRAGATIEAEKITIDKDSSLAVGAGWYNGREPIRFIGNLENKGVLGGGTSFGVEIEGDFNNVGEVAASARLNIKGNFKNSGKVVSPFSLHGNLNNSGTILQGFYLFNNLDGSDKELVFSVNDINSKIYLQEDINLSKKVREIPLGIKPQGHKLILADGSYLKLKDIDSLEFEGKNLVLETSLLKDVNLPTAQVILSGEGAQLFGSNVVKNILNQTTKTRMNSGILQVESLEISENSEFYLTNRSSIKGKILNRGTLSSHYGTQPLIIEDDFTNLGETPMAYIYFKNNYPNYSYFIKEKNNPEGTERQLSTRGFGARINSEIRSKKPYDLIIKKENGEIFKIFKINQEMDLPEIKIPPVEPEKLKITFSHLKNMLENEEREITLTLNRTLKTTDSSYNSDTNELNFYLTTNFQEGSNVFPEVISIPLDQNLEEIPITFKISKPMSMAKIYIKNDKEEILGESNFFNVFETQKVFFRIPKRYKRFGQLTISEINGNNLENLNEVEKVNTPSNQKIFSKNIKCDQSYVFDYTGKDNTNLIKTFRHVTAIRCNSPYIVSFQQEKPLSNEECKNQGKVPVLLVPGIMGSDAKNNWSVYPEIPKESPAWDSGELVIHDPGLNFPVFNKGFNPGWEDIRDSLEDDGYTRKCNIIDVPYDWRLEIPEIRNQYLIPWINEAKRLTGQGKVDIVAHSMGGLVVRSYIQSQSYNNDIRNFVMVGTPNKGASLTYPIWEGGDPIYIDKHYNENGLFKPAKYFYTNTIYENYQEITGKSDLCIWKHVLSDIPIACNEEKVYDLVHKNVPSLGQLLPVYENAFFNSTSGAISIENEKNEFLLALNNGGTYKNETFSLPESIKQKTLGNDIIFYSNKFNATAYKINVSAMSNSNLLYKDGVLYNIIDSVGDGTVPFVSVGIGGISFANDVGDEQHGFLINSLKDYIVKFITSPVL